VILSKERDPRLVTVRRGGTLTDDDHRLLAVWAAECAEHVLPLFDAVRPGDDRPRRGIEAARAWVRGELRMMEARGAAFPANAAAREVTGAARFAALSAGQASAVAHVAEHDLGAAAYALRAVASAAPAAGSLDALRHERDWQIAQLPEGVRVLVLEDQRRRDDLCWHVFSR
jgi:immunity protein 5 of polymorphic toxin system